MSTFSEAWHACLPAVRDFYRNFSERHYRLCNRWPDGYPEFPYEYFSAGPMYWHRPLGKDVFYSQMTAQLSEWGHLQPALIIWDHPSYLEWEGYRPRRGATGFPPWSDQWLDMTVWAWNYPREKRKAPKQYWTGKPRRRLNL